MDRFDQVRRIDFLPLVAGDFVSGLTVDLVVRLVGLASMLGDASAL